MSKRHKIKTRSRHGQPIQKIEKTSTGGKTSIWPSLVSVLILTGLAILPMLGNGFTNWDDDIYVTGNPLLRGPDWNAIFTEPSASNYHPFTIITLAFNYAIAGTDPFSYHLLNWLLHVLNTALVFLFIYRISGRKIYVAAFCSVIFGVHPMHVESVAWISERKDVLYALFFLLALLQYWSFLETGKRLKFILCFIFFILSLLSKPAAIILPIVLYLLDYWYNRTFDRKVWAEKIPFFILSIAFGFITVNVQSAGAIAGLDIYPLWVRFFFACYTLMIYTARFFVPYPLSTFHPYPPVDALGWPVYLSPVFVIASLILLWVKRRDKLIVFSLLFFIVNLILVLQFITIGLTIVSERYTYVPYIGLSFVIGVWLNRYFDSSSNKIFIALPFIIGIIFGVISFQRTKVWKDGDTLWADVIKRYPDAATPRSNHANYLKKMAAMPEYKSRETELLQEALDDCNIAIKVKPTHMKAYENRQNIYLMLKKDSLAMADADRLLKLDPSNAAAFYTKGFAYMRFNMFDSSVLWFNKSIASNPNADWVINARGTLLFNGKHYNEALTDFARAIELNPLGEYFYNRSMCYFTLGDVTKAKSDVLSAIQKGFNVPATYKTTLQIDK